MRTVKRREMVLTGTWARAGATQNITVYVLTFFHNHHAPEPSLNRDCVSPFLMLKLCKRTERLVRSGVQKQAQKSPEQIDRVGNVCGLLGGKVYHFGVAANYDRCKEKFNSSLIMR